MGAQHQRVTSALDSFFSLWQVLSTRGASDALEQRIQAFTEACHSGQSLESTLLQAELHRRRGRLPDAIEMLADVQQGLTEAQPLELQALAWLTSGHLQREQGEFRAAAEAFIQAFALQPTLLASLHALQFTRLTPDQKQDLTGSLRAVVQGCHQAPPLALQLLADWQQECGQTLESLQLSYRAAQLSVGTAQRSSLDRLSPPDLPDALIIGAPKSGTTSLAGWLAAHPQIYVHPRKELHFFDSHRWDWGVDWYRCQFPRFRPDRPPVVRMEATPNYLQLGHVPARVRRLMPDARLIVILRHPLKRALSWCHHIIRQEGVEATPEQILSAELQQLAAGDATAWTAEGAWHPTNCLFGSLYSTQLERWHQHFSAEQFLVLQLESTLTNPAAAWQLIATFLELDLSLPSNVAPNTIGSLPHLNPAPAAYHGLPESIGAELERVLDQEIRLWDSLASPGGWRL